MNITSAQYFTFNVHNSILLVGQTGTGKSYLVHKLISDIGNLLETGAAKLALFDMKQVEFTDYNENKPEILLFPVETGRAEGLALLMELAELTKDRLKEESPKPLIFIYVEEWDIAAVYQKEFDEAVIYINEHAKDANMKLIYSTSAPAPDVVSKKLLHSFELVLSSVLQERDYEYLELEYSPSIVHHNFLVTERSPKNE